MEFLLFIIRKQDRKRKGNMKLCFTASSGGHLEEITCLRQITNENDSFLITEKSGEDITTAWGDRTYFLRQINRKEPFFLIHFIYLEEGKAGLYHIHRSIDDISGLSVR